MQIAMASSSSSSSSGSLLSWLTTASTTASEMSAASVVVADDSGDNSSSNNDSDQDVTLRKKRKVSTKQKRRTSAKKDKFRSKWLVEFPWIRYDKAKNVMFCDLCCTHKKDNPYVNGTQNFKKTNVKRHAHSSDHLKAQEANQCESLTTLAGQARNRRKRAVEMAMRNVYWLAKEEVATMKYESLNQLLQLQGCTDIEALVVGRNAKYTSYHIAEEMQNCISDYLKANLQQKLGDVDFVGLMTDESTDISMVKSLVVYVRFVHSGRPETHFLQLIEMNESATGAAIAEKIRQVASDWGIPATKCVGIASDGARAMTGKENGAIAHLKQVSPCLIPIHCVAHRLALASSQAAKSIPRLMRYQRVLIAVYSYFSHSCIRVHNLHEIQKIVDDPQICYHAIYEVRWLSFFAAVQAVKRSIKSLHAFFEKESEELGDPTAAGLAKGIAEFMFLAITHLLYDVLNELTRLSKVFQKDSIDFSIIAPSVRATISTLEAMATVPGPVLSEFLSETTASGELAKTFQGIILRGVSSDIELFSRLSVTFLGHVVENLQSRFPQTILISAMAILDPRSLPSDNSDLASYGMQELDQLIQHFAQCPELQITQSCKEEWPCLKQLASASYKSHSVEDFWAVVAQKHKDQFPCLLKLAHACLTLPVSTVCCERGFSTQNRIKTKLRNRMKMRRLDVLMRISEEGPPVKDLDFSKPIEMWCKLKDRRILHH